jgi:hypothetical protein
VVEPFTPDLLRVTYEWAKGLRGGPLRHTTQPLVGLRAAMTRAEHYLAGSKIDLAWLLPLPVALGAFLRRVEALDPHLREHGLLFSELWTHCAVVAFELESSAGKHAGGGLLNLAAYGVLGVAVTPSARLAQDLQEKLERYRPTLGLRNVYVRELA